MKIVWLLYRQEDLSVNRDYARLMRENGLKRDIKVETVLTRDLSLCMDENGTPYCLRKGKKERPDALLPTLGGQTGLNAAVELAKDGTLDKYGAETKFRRDVNKASNWYYENLLSYRRDTVKGIRDQVDEALTFGYRFDFKRYNLYIDIAPGPAVRYINADDYDTKWVAMAVVSESLHWDISKFMAFEQKLYAGFNLQKPSEYSVNFGLALLMHATEVMDIALRYTYSYDAVNADTAQKSEQTLLLSFEFPFNWK